MVCRGAKIRPKMITAMVKKKALMPYTVPSYCDRVCR